MVSLVSCTLRIFGNGNYFILYFFLRADDVRGKLKPLCIHLNRLDDIVKRKALEVSMSRSDTGLTTWSKLKKGSSTQLQRYRRFYPYK